MNHKPTYYGEILNCNTSPKCLKGGILEAKANTDADEREHLYN